MSTQQDYIFHYKLEVGDNKRALYQDLVIEMIRRQLENILNLVVLVYQGKEVKVDGFKLLRDRETVYKIFPIDRECE